MKAIEHLRTINHHKLLVMKGCFKVGLYRQGLMHDLSKYTPSEFLVGCKYYQGNRSPNNAEREATGVSSAWLHHKGRNKHHYEYWIDYSLNKEEGIVGMRMPTRYVVEMFVDRVSASKTYQKDAYEDWNPLEYYDRSGKAWQYDSSGDGGIITHLLEMLAEEGEDATWCVYTQNRISQ